jgi:hypothetical protein
MPTTIVINYKSKPPGQVGARPHKLAPGEDFVFTSEDGTDLTVDFLGNSPLKTGTGVAKQGEVLTAANKPGRYPFKCSMTVDGEPVTLGDPNDPNSVIGGELEVGPG